MNILSLLNNISYNLSSIAHCTLGQEWNYENIISPFSRLYLITEGEAHMLIGDKSLKLKKGYLYLVPSFIQCTYKCPKYMEQYYATFSIKLSDGLNIYQLFNFINEIKAEPHHFSFFKKLYDLNRGMHLPTGNPNVYQKRMKLGINKNKISDASNILKSAGLLDLLISDFISTPKMNLESEVHNRISHSIKYIHSNIQRNITIGQLASLCHLSPDHYTRKFKELTHQTPLDYINKQRIEKSLLLLDTSSKPIGEIADLCGFSCPTNFGKVFKKYIHQSPRDYKNSINFKNEYQL
ncbi:AraC family transcriptional regulator [Saccharicrinis aurantiacus]|uniref:AraC family transcriptional regulator n=1 Tax=Saccharicrinis aurantiacus TaxID=1849719 RepID=UPI000837E5F6|nr:AraC family transcriptional regulator [Saccharicrinis aurantiacus]